MQVVHRDLARLLPCRGGGDNALDALLEPRRQRSRDDDALIERLRHRMRAEGARERGKAHVAAALALARADPAPVPTRDDPWWNDYPEVGRGSRYLVGTTYKADVQRLLPSLLHPPAPPRPTAATPPPALPSPPLAPPPMPALATAPPPSLKEQADAVEAEILKHEADRDAHLAAAAEEEARIRPLRQRLQSINQQRMMAAWHGVASREELIEATGPTQAPAVPVARVPSAADSAASLSSEAAALHAEIDHLYNTLPEFVYERNEHERLVMGEQLPKRVSWCGRVYNVPRP